MFAKMLAFEWRYYVRQPSFYVTCLVFFLLPFLATVSDNVRIGGGGNVLYNSSFAITQTMLILGIFSMFLVVNFVASTATRNESSQMSEILYCKPIKPLPYQLGRFMGAYAVILTVFAMVPIGILLGTLMPWVDSERLGPTNLGFYIDTYLYFSAPTLFILSCLFYTIALRFKTMMSVYLAAIALFTLYIISGFFTNEPELRAIAALSDPFGLRTFSDISRYWTAHERNTQALEFTGVLLQNRVIWLVASVLILALFGKLASELTLPARTAGKKEKKANKNESNATPLNNKIDYLGNPSAGWIKFKARTKFEMSQIFFSAPFYVLLAFSAANLIGAFFVPGSFYGTSDWPLTYAMVNHVWGGFATMIIIVITYYSGEVVWRERGSGMGDIVESMPVFNFTFWLSKLLSVSLVIVSLLLMGMLVTIGYQVIKGVESIDIIQYLVSLMYFYALPMIMLTILAFFIQVLSPNKFVGMLFFVGYFLATLAFNQLGLEHNLVNFAGSPQFTYSDMNGYGWFLQTHSWYMLYWGAFSVVLSALGFAMWQRGPQASIMSRVRLLGYHLGTTGKATLAASLLVFAVSGSYIYYNTSVLNDYITTEEGLDLQAQYEKKYIEFLAKDIPVINKVNATVDISPKSRSINATLEFQVVNNAQQPIERFLVNRPSSNTTSWSVELAGGSVKEIDEQFNIGWFVFDEPLQPGEMREGVMKVVRENLGFRDKGFDTQVVENGTFINNFELFPSFGVNQGYFIADRHERRKRDLPAPKRANKLEDESFYNESFFGKGVAFIDFEATVSTDVDQVAIAPGYLQNEWVEGDKRYFHYKMDAPMVNFYAFLSARLDVKKEVHDGINIEVYYHPEHHMNVDIMIESTKASIDYFNREFGQYQHKQMRIIEFPGYRSFAQSFANTVPYSERIGFVTDLRDPENIDPVYYVTAHELAHQWWGHQVGAANVQGSAILSESLSQYSAIMVMVNKFGEDKLRKFLKYELDRYLRGRTSEFLEEMPLMRAENQAYIHYRKGSVAMMSIKDRLGEEKLNGVLKDLLTEFKYSSSPYPTTLDLVSRLKAVSNDEEKAFIASLFEDITLYDLKADKVEVATQESGEHQVTFTVQAKRFTADGKGVESKAELNEYIDVVMFSEDPEDLTKKDTVLYQKKHLITDGENVIKIDLKSLPKYAGIDPFVKLVDRDSADNVIKL